MTNFPKPPAHTAAFLCQLSRARMNSPGIGVRRPRTSRRSAAAAATITGFASPSRLCTLRWRGRFLGDYGAPRCASSTLSRGSLNCRRFSSLIHRVVGRPNGSKRCASAATSGSRPSMRKPRPTSAIGCARAPSRAATRPSCWPGSTIA
jgi:hypothetical protein